VKAARYYGKEDIRIEEIEEPQIRPGTVKIAPAFNGVCGSDLHLFHDGPIPPAPTDTEPHPISGETLPVVFGHEFSGVVEEVGEGVEGIAVGDHVAVEPLMVDGTGSPGWAGASPNTSSSRSAGSTRWATSPSTRPRSSSRCP
jgi:(R,R)-butanediol dehydrogenase/meso-butanediol dehydrogenase/diacetyl reductase